MNLFSNVLFGTLRLKPTELSEILEANTSFFDTDGFCVEFVVVWETTEWAVIFNS